LQTRWYRFGEAFEVPVDASPWADRAYRGGCPDRDRFDFRGTTFGLKHRDDAPDGHRFNELSGVYLISYRGRPIYVGRARGRESIMSRLGKHRLKLTGSNAGKGICHPTRWERFVRHRYAANPALAENDALLDFSFSAFIVRGPTTPEQLKTLEGRVYWAVTNVFDRSQMLNSPHHVKYVPADGLRVVFESE
jgi:hypothetical protein